MLADNRRVVGWHPDFESRLQAVFDAPTDEAAP